MTIDSDNLPMGSLIKIGVPSDAQNPESHKGDSPHGGTIFFKPEVGQPFLMSTEKGAFRTSYVKEIIEETDNKVVFNTNNSVYQLTINLFEGID